jgi:predicted esterase
MLASVQGLHAFYRGRTEEVVASWMTRFDRARTIDDNIRFVNAVLDEIGREHSVERRVFAGFSQGVAMAFRAALRGAHRAAAVIALGGDVPPELRELAPEAWRGLRVLIGRGASDPWYTETVMAADATFLRSRAVDVRTFVFEGGHEWAAEFSAEAGRLLAEIARSTSSG